MSGEESRPGMLALTGSGGVVSRPMSNEAYERRAAEAALERRAEQQTALYQFTDRLYRAESSAQVYEAALDAIIRALGCSRASILFFDESATMRFVAARGLSEGYRAAVEGHSPWTADTENPDPIFIEDIDAAGFAEDLRATIRNEGIGALAFIPIVANAALAGKFMAYYDAPHAFDDEEKNLALVIARQLGFAVARMRLEDMRRRAEQALRESEQRVQLALQAGRMGAWEWEIKTGRVIWSPGLEAIHGLPPGSFGGTFDDFKRGVHPEDLARVLAQIEQAIGQGDDYHVVFRVPQPDGAIQWVEGFGRVSLDPDGGQPIKLSGVCMNVTERKRAETALRVSEERLRLALSASRTIAWTWDFGAGLIEMAGHAAWDPALPSSLPDSELWQWIHPEDAEMVRRTIEHAREERSEFTFDCRAILRSTGDIIWIQNRGAIQCDSDGRPIRAIGTATDVTEAKRAEQQRTLLINELNHRVKNTLATVQALALQTLRGGNGETLRRFQARLGALSAAHDLLTTQNWESAGLRDVVDRALAPFRIGHDRIAIEGPEVRLTPRQALAMSMALHELATNAAKYGALSGEHGRVRISWSTTPHDGLEELRLLWSESGGPPVERPVRIGFGARLINKNLAHDLGAPARIEYRPEGVFSEIRTALEHSVAA